MLISDSDIQAMGCMQFTSTYCAAYQKQIVCGKKLNMVWMYVFMLFISDVGIV